VHEVLPHPGFYKNGKHQPADRLDIVKFQFADGTVPYYQCVTGKGTFITGELAIYVSDDMLVPVAHPAFEFLTKRLDYKAGQTMYRVRAAKLRGEISTGMLLPSTLGMGVIKLGQDMSDKLGVVKYESPIDKAAAQHALYAGPESRFTRLVRRVSNYLTKPFSPPEYGVIALRKVPTYFKEGEPVLFTEKVHGANMRFGKHKGKVYIGSHRSEKSDRRNWLVRLLTRDRRSPGWYGTDVWSEWFRRTFSTKSRLDELPNNIIFYGELYGPGIQKNYDYGLEQTEVFVYDAYDTKKKRWLSYPELLGLLPSFVDLVKVHHVPYFLWTRLMDDVEVNSEMGKFPRKNIIKEGIVVRSVDWARAGKYVSTQYLESDR
jgi:RNA ligase (TIGR02306 family)